jgi:chemotaxis protein CheD
MSVSNYREGTGTAAGLQPQAQGAGLSLAEEIKVGMGDIVVARAPNTLAIIGLGSCVGVAMYYPKERIGGLAHIMLPDSTKSRSNTSREKFADPGLPILLERLKKSGAEQLWIAARLVGGASMFKATSTSGTNPMFNIGENNVRACWEFLKKEHIRVVGEEVLGTGGSTMRFDLTTLAPGFEVSEVIRGHRVTFKAPEVARGHSVSTQRSQRLQRTHRGWILILSCFQNVLCIILWSLCDLWVETLWPLATSETSTFGVTPNFYIFVPIISRS